MSTLFEDSITFTKAVSFGGNVTFDGEGEDPAFSLDNLTDLTGSGTCTFADLVATDDVTVGDDLAVVGLATIGETLAVTGATTLSSTLAVTGAITATTHYTSTNGNITLTNGTLTAADVTTTDDLTVGDDLSVTGIATIAESLVVTGATVVGLHEHITLAIPNLVGADAKVYGINCPVAGTVTRIASRLGGAALTTGDATITGKIGAVAITTGAITIAQSGSAEGDLDSVTPSGANTVAVGSDLNFTVGGTNDETDAFATLTITIRRTA